MIDGSNTRAGISSGQGGGASDGAGVASSCMRKALLHDSGSGVCRHQLLPHSVSQNSPSLSSPFPSVFAAQTIAHHSSNHQPVVCDKVRDGGIRGSGADGAQVHH